MNKFYKTNFHFFIIIISCFVITLLIYYFIPTDLPLQNAKIHDLMLKLRYQIYGKQNINPLIVHIDLDDHSIENLKISVYNRLIYAELIEALAQAHVNKIAMQIIFQVPGSAEEDNRLLDAVKKYQEIYFPGVVRTDEFNGFLNPVLIKSQKETIIKESLIYPEIKKIGKPKSGSFLISSFPNLYLNSRGFSLINADPDKDGIYRRIPLLIKYQNGYIPNMALRVICDYLSVDINKIEVVFGKEIILKNALFPAGLTKDIKIPIDIFGNMLINYAGPWNNSFIHYSFESILRAFNDKKINELKDELEGAIVIISDVSARNTVLGRTSLEKVYPLSGIHANLMNSILTGNMLSEANLTWLFIECVIMILLLCFLAGRFDTIGYIISTSILFLIFIVWGIINSIYYYRLIPLIIPSVSILTSLLLVSASKLYAVYENNLKLKEQDKVKSRFFANISHEFRTPLTLILTPLEALMQGEYGSTLTNNHPLFKKMQINILRLLKMINHILDISKIESGNMVLNRQIVDISKLLEYYIACIQPTVENRKIKLIFMDNTNGMKVYIDKDLLEKAFFNLISNAIKFTPADGTIIIQLDYYSQNRKMQLPMFIKTNKNIISNEYPAYFQISIADTGIGIPEEQQESIFNRFVQSDNVIRTPYEGTGIGLSLVQEIVKLHGGQIKLKSKVGKGSTFTLIFPQGLTGLNKIKDEIRPYENVKTYLMSDILPGEILTADIMDDSGRFPLINVNPDAYLILIVEDNADMRSLLASMLNQHYRVISAVDGKTGLQMSVVEKPDLILSDIMMPGMNGYEMIRQIREIPDLQDVPVIFLSALAEIPNRIEGLEKGANDYIAKPFNARELLARIKSQIELKALRDDLKKKNLEIIKQNNELAKMDQKMVDIIETLPSSIIDITHDLQIRYINLTGKVLLGINNYVGKKISQYVQACEQDEFIKEITDLFKTHLSQEVYQHHFVQESGQLITILLKCTILKDDQNNFFARLVLIESKTVFYPVITPDEEFFRKYEISEREKDVLYEIVKGSRNKAIGEKLFISEVTVKKHISSIFQKTNITSRDELLKLIKESRK